MSKQNSNKRAKKTIKKEKKKKIFFRIEAYREAK